ncbi:MAG: Glu-tRNA(Gln) amidotransferase subunit GatD [Thermoplasmata archaeon]
MPDFSKTKYGSKLLIRYKGTDIHCTFISVEKGILTVKLENGYNAAFLEDSIELINSEPPRAARKKDTGTRVVESGISILSTGGTITSKIDYSTGAVSPSEDIDWVLENAGMESEKETIDFSIIESVLSENMTPSHWIRIASGIKEKMERGNGIIVFHGTDTMSYTASAISFMFESQTRPIVFTGSQRSSDRPSSDSYLNVEGSIAVAKTNLGEVAIAMHRNSSDVEISVIRAVRSRKMHTSMRSAFKAIDEKEIAFYADKNVNFVSSYRKVSDKIELFTRLEQKVGMVYFYPGITSSDFESISNGKRSMIIMGTGLGHVSEELIGSIRGLIRNGTRFVMTSQCFSGNVNPYVYSTGRKLRDAGVMYFQNMLPEVAFVKSMYVLGKYGDEEFETRMSENIRGEINSRITERSD